MNKEGLTIYKIMTRDITDDKTGERVGLKERDEKEKQFTGIVERC